MKWKPLLFAICAVIAPVASAQTYNTEPPLSAEERAWQEEQVSIGRAYTLRLADAVAAEGGARDLALAVILRSLANVHQDQLPPGSDQASRRVPPDAQAGAWRRAAASNAGNDVMANQLLIAAKGDVDAGLRLQSAQRWARAEPDNLVPLLYQGLPVDTLLARARTASRSDLHFYDNVRWIMSAYLQHSPTTEEARALTGGEAFRPEEAAALAAMGVWMAVAVPGFNEVSEACRGHALRATPSRLADCRHFATLLADQSGSAIERRIGLGMLREAAQNTLERSDIDARQRRMDWQMLNWGEVSVRQERDGAAQFVRLLRDESIRTEQQLMERVLQEAGVPLEPPAGWISPWRQQR